MPRLLLLIRRQKPAAAMTAPAAKRPRAPALEAAVSTLAVPGLGEPLGLMVLADGNRLVSTAEHTILALLTSGQLVHVSTNRAADGVMGVADSATAFGMEDVPRDGSLPQLNQMALAFGYSSSSEPDGEDDTTGGQGTADTAGAVDSARRGGGGASGRRRDAAGVSSRSGGMGWLMPGNGAGGGGTPPPSPRSGDVMRERELDKIRQRLARCQALKVCLSEMGSSPSDIWQRLKKTTDASIVKLPTLADLWGSRSALATWLHNNAHANARCNKVQEEESDTDR